MELRLAIPLEACLYYNILDQTVARHRQRWTVHKLYPNSTTHNIFEESLGLSPQPSSNRDIAYSGESLLYL